MTNEPCSGNFLTFVVRGSHIVSPQIGDRVYLDRDLTFPFLFNHAPGNLDVNHKFSFYCKYFAYQSYHYIRGLTLHILTNNHKGRIGHFMFVRPRGANVFVPCGFENVSSVSFNEILQNKGLPDYKLTNKEIDMIACGNDNIPKIKQYTI